MTKGLTVREACRRRMTLDGADAQALEHALAITERERNAETERALTAEARAFELERRITDAHHALCSCGGAGPGEGCVACEMWHRVFTVTPQPDGEGEEGA